MQGHHDVTPRVVLAPDDPRVQPAPEKQYREVRSVRLSHHRYRRLAAEVEATDESRQDIIDVAIGEYSPSATKQHRLHRHLHPNQW